jgi:large subunit ribosomal protein L25
MTMQQFELVAEPRSDVGKGASRRLRRDGQVPGVLYGAGKDPLMFKMSHNDLLLQLEQEAFSSHVLTLKLDGAAESVVLKDLQRHPYKAQILHLDLQRIAADEELTMLVPIHFINEAICIGVKRDGGVISHLMSEIEIECLPKDLPEFIEVDTADLEIGQILHLTDLTMPAGVAIASLKHGGDASQPVVSVQLPKVAGEELEGEEEEATEEEVAPGGEEV